MRRRLRAEGAPNIWADALSVAVCLVDGFGNPTRHGTAVTLTQTGTAGPCGARAREAVALGPLGCADQHAAGMLAMQNLAVATVEDTAVGVKSHRSRRASGWQTLRLRRRLTPMAATRDVAVAA